MDRHIGQEPSPPESLDDAPLYAARKAIYPQSVRGTYRTVRWIVLIATLGIYYLLPFVRYDRGPNAPHQAVLIDLPGRRFYFFFIEIWPQEVYYITGLLILAAVALFLMNAVAGRVWCGYLCPQTVWTDLFYAVERLVEGLTNGRGGVMPAWAGRLDADTIKALAVYVHTFGGGEK